MALGLVFPSSSAALAAEDASPAAARVAKATDVVQQWRPHQRLYVKGNLGVGDAQLDALEKWLDERAPNWVVVLAESAAGERYTDAEGKSFTGVDAVEHALGKGLRNQTTFGAHTDPRTQEPDGACFLLSLKDRRLWYSSAAAQDRRDLGSEHWAGQLDRPAVEAMRGGARVVDAVRDTITSINDHLTTRIRAEAEARAQRAAAAEAERQQAFERAKAACGNAASALAAWRAKAAGFQQQHPEATGNLARPDQAALEAELQLAKAALDRGDSAAAGSRAKAVAARIEVLLRALDQYAADGAKLPGLAQRLEDLGRNRRAAVARHPLDSARSALDTARTEYQRADAGYLTHLARATEALDAAEAGITGAARLAAQRRALLGVGSFGFLASLGLVALVLNRRRLGVKREAEALCGAWEKGLGEKTFALFDLLDRRETVVGGSVEDAARRYSGESLKLGQQAIQDVDELFIMSACAGRILEDAQGLLKPTILWPQLGNLFFKQRYSRALRLLRDQPVAFNPGEPIDLVVRGARTERDRLLGDLAAYQPFTLTFNSLIEEFNQRAARALASLDKIQSSLVSLGGTLDGIQKDLDQVRSLEAALSQAAAGDGRFALTEVFSQLLPAAQTELGAATKMGLTDPVGALQVHGEQANRQAREALALARLVLEFRAQALPVIGERASQLRAAGLSVQWVGAELDRFSATANQLARQGHSGAVQTEIQRLQKELNEFSQRTQRCVQLDEARRCQTAQQLAEAQAAINTTRQELGAALGVEPARVLREIGADPDAPLGQANDQAQAASAALERGDPDAATRALDAVTQLTRQVLELVAATRRAFAEEDPALNSLRAEAERVAGLVPERERLLAEITAGYAPSVLWLGAGDPVHPNANGTIADNVEEARGHLTAAETLQADSLRDFQAARLLAAADQLRQARGRLETAAFRLDEISEKHGRLAETEAANAALLAGLEERQAACQRLSESAATMPPTIQLFEQAAQALSQTRFRVGATGGDPFATAQALAAIASSLEEVADKARCDRDVFEETERAAKAAAAQVAQAARLAAESASDNVADSAAIRQARSQTQALESGVAQLQLRLREPHGDWPGLGREADQIAQEASRQRALLRGELDRAQAAVAALMTAAAAVRAAGGWTGLLGVRIFGSPGSDLLARARGLLEQGQYEPARASAQSARQMAELAIAEAEAEVRRRRRAEEERRERERRRREAEEAQRARSVTPSWSGGGDSSWGGSGSGGSGSTFSTGSGGQGSSW